MDSCGLGTWFRPPWLRRFATPRWFLAVYGLLGTIQAMAFIYFVATLTTLEKRFKIPSKTTGILMSGNEVSQILLSLSLSYYGGQGNRPRWIAWGVACAAISCFILALPHAAYGPGRHALALTEEYQSSYNSSDSTRVVSMELCSAMDAASDCDADALAGEFSVMPLLLIFLSQFVLGVGTTLYYALGQTYLDDNTKKTNTPLMLACVMALRTVGPALGFMLGFACLRVYIEPSLTPLINNKDPRWLGAWWLGWVILGLTMLLLSVLIAMFPKQLPRSRPISTQSDTRSMSEEQPLRKPSFVDFIPKNPDEKPSKGVLKPIDPSEAGFVPSLKRLLTNKLLMCNNLAAVFYILGASGYITFATKYMETQFQQSASGANITAGTVGISAMVAGFLISGIVISKFKPRAVYLLGWNVFVGLGYVVCEIIFIFLGCSNIAVEGLDKIMQSGQSHIVNTCNAGCNCGNVKYSPVCFEEFQMTFYSACHAGCKSVLSTDSPQKIFSNCSCTSVLQPTNDYASPNDDYSKINLVAGACPSDCWSIFQVFIALTFFMHILGSSGKVGNVLVNYRCVKVEDKSFAQGLTLLMVSLLAFIPGPILYGAIIDSTCLVWDDTCKQKGNCWLYDKDFFRLYVNSTAAVLTIIGVALDLTVCILGRSLKFYEETEEEQPRQLTAIVPISS